MTKITPEVSFVDMSIIFLPENLCLLTLPEEVDVIRELRSTPSAVGLKKRFVEKVNPIEGGPFGRF